MDTSLNPSHEASTGSLGFTLVEAIISLGLLSLFVAGGLSMYERSSAAMVLNRQLSLRDIENNEMIKWLSEPTYFGLLGSYEVNAQLKKCMMPDGVTCNQADTYPLTAIDLRTGTPLSSASGSGQGRVENTLSFQVRCPGNAMSCDTAEYFVVTVRTKTFNEAGLTRDVQKKAMVVPMLDRVMPYYPDTTVSNGRPINVILFVDSSNSMLWAKSQINAGLDSLLAKLSTMNATLGIFPLSPFTSTFAQACDDGNGNKVPCNVTMLPGGSYYYDIRGFKFNAGVKYPASDITFGTTTYDFLSTDTDAVRNAKVATAKARIQALFTTNSDYFTDAPLCGLLSYFEDGIPSMPVDPMTPTIAMIVTNEDDESILTDQTSELKDWVNSARTNCLKSITIKMKKADQQTTHMGKQYYFKVTGTGQFMSDGAPVTKSTSLSLSVNYSPDLDAKLNQSCLAEPNLPNLLATELKNPYLYYVSDFQVTSCTVVRVGLLLGMGPTLGTCVAKESEYRVTYPTYIPDSCIATLQNAPGTGYSSTSAGYDSLQIYAAGDTTAHATNDIVLALSDTIKAKVKASNLLFIPVIHPTAGGCTLTPGAQPGARYEQLAKLLGQEGNITPVCAPSYIDKLSQLTDFINSIAASDIQLSTAVAQSMRGVSIERDGKLLTPIAGVDYKLVGTSLVFVTGYVQPTDRILVYY